MRDYKTTAMVLAAFAAGMMYAVACTGGKAHGGIDSASADSSCSSWSVRLIESTNDACSDAACQIDAGWEPIGMTTSYDVIARKCTD